jgi:CDP-diacylglycerol---serine O-phosphatidyltransferase
VIDRRAGGAASGVRRGVYVLPALFTLGNVLCGYLSIDAAHQMRFHTAASLLFLAGILDGLDGRVARLTGSTSAFGEQLDSLADVISFGVAPAFLAYRWGLAGFDRLGLAVSFLFVVCGACRLARFNVQVHVVDKRFFVGLPIPAGAAAVAGIVWVHPDPLPTPAWSMAYLAYTVVVAYLMISTFRYRSFKDLDLKSKKSVLLVPVFGLVLGAMAWKTELSFTVLALVFACSAPATKLLTMLGFFRPKKADAPVPAP